MKFFWRARRYSASHAKDRMRTILCSERLSCSPQMIEMIQNDIVKSVQKYLIVDEKKISVQISRNPPILYAEIPVAQKRNG